MIDSRDARSADDLAALKIADVGGFTDDGITGADVLTLHLSGPIEAGQSFSCQTVLQFLSSACGVGRIHLVINSQGGDYAEARAIYGTLRAVPLPISAEVIGRCCSAAVVVLIAASFRWARAGAKLMIHRAGISADALEPRDRLTCVDLIRKAKELHAIDSNIAELLSLSTGQSRCWFEREMATEGDLGDLQAIESGLLHAIEGRASFSADNLALLDRLKPSDLRSPSQLLAANYRQATRVAALCGGTALNKGSDAK